MGALIVLQCICLLFGRVIRNRLLAILRRLSVLIGQLGRDVHVTHHGVAKDGGKRSVGSHTVRTYCGYEAIVDA